jgi:hypothetical protein
VSVALGAVVLGEELAALAGAVGVAGEGGASAWWTRRSIMAAATTSSENVSPQRPKGRFEVTMTEPCS